MYLLCRGAADLSREQIAHGNPRQVKRMGGINIIGVICVI